MPESTRKDLELKQWRGRALYDQEKYSKAEEVLRRVVRGQERILGQDDEDTVESKHWLGCILHDQKKYIEAETVLRQAVRGHERILGQYHENTIKSKDCLGRTLIDQEKYSEAETVLQQAVRGWKKILGQDDEDTLWSKYWLGCALHQQRKYSEAEKVLQQVVRGQEKILGQDDKTTLWSKYCLGRTLHQQRKYSEAEKVLEQAVRGHERLLGQHHENTIESKDWLQRVLQEQRKSNKAKSHFQQTPDGQERTLSGESKDTPTNMRLLQKLHLNSSPSLPNNHTTQQALASRLSSFFSEGQHSRESYTDSEINEISSLLKHSNPQWSKMPRTYVVLRTIGYLNVLDDLIDVGFSDYWFPVTECSLPGCLLPSAKASFVRAQNLVLSKSMDLEKGEKGHHCYYGKGDSPPFERKGILGRGGFGEVDRVLSLISFREYARKQVPRGLAFKGRQKEDIKRFIAEIKTLKRLKHHHIVEFVGSYTDSKCIALIMSPIAEMDLAAYLKHADDSNLPELRTFFGCLATALEFLHAQKVRHKDIKPGNILIKGGKVLFADFGLSLDFVDASGSTTVSMVNGMTPRYCAPEVAQYQPRNTASDIWSLGVVFMEMIVVLKGRTAQYMDEFFRQHGSQQAFIRTNPAALSEFIAELEGVGDLFDNRALGWAQQMLSMEQQSRPTATSLVVSITATSHEGEGMGFCGICCVSLDEEFSDWVDE